MDLYEKLFLSAQQHEGTNPIDAASVLANKVGYINGQKVTGTMVDRSGDTAALSSSVSGTTLKLLASAGYRDGTNDNVTITDEDFTAENIKDGVTLFGVEGTFEGGGDVTAYYMGDVHTIAIVPAMPTITTSFTQNE